MNKNLIITLAVLGILGVALFAMNSGSTETEPTPTPTQPVEVVEEPAVEMEEQNTIVDIAVGSDDFTTLVTAVTEAGLVETLSGEGPFTVFAPTDEAFAKVPAETLQALLADKEELTKVLTYHVVPGKVMAADVVELTSATTVQGQDITIEVTPEGKVMVNDAEVVITDIEASNGVIHVIDSVILPE